MVRGVVLNFPNGSGATCLVRYSFTLLPLRSFWSRPALGAPIQVFLAVCRGLHPTRRPLIRTLSPRALRGLRSRTNEHLPSLYVPHLHRRLPYRFPPIRRLLLGHPFSWSWLIVSAGARATAKQVSTSGAACTNSPPLVARHRR